MERTLPQKTTLTEPWLDACNRGVLLLQKCSTCDKHQFYPRIICSHCGAGQPDWVETSGRGRIASFSIVRRAISKAYEAPYVVALIELEEGPVMMSNIVGCDPGAVEIGQAVTVTFEAWSDDITLPVFKPADSEAKQ
jgi:uncharacterized OB-fold protein